MRKTVSSDCVMIQNESIEDHCALGDLSYKIRLYIGIPLLQHCT